ncbi:MAG: hypothetical protein LBL67_04700 [Coriobacteriales bacterium]|jgi:hypothetical protein|nr:hypothetical protein [Coriobacteriales bacterium]
MGDSNIGWIQQITGLAIPDWVAWIVLAVIVVVAVILVVYGFVSYKPGEDSDKKDDDED